MLYKCAIYFVDALPESAKHVGEMSFVIFLKCLGADASSPDLAIWFYKTSTWILENRYLFSFVNIPSCGELVEFYGRVRRKTSIRCRLMLFS